MLSLNLLSQYEAFGLLIAAKSILRFAEVQQDQVRKKSEYVLVGTLFSLVVTLAVGILAQSLIL